MAILHQATLTPTKLELVESRLDKLGLGQGNVTLIGGYRYDDPDGQVGVEGLIALRDGAKFQVPLTYRDAPLEGAQEWLVATMEHSFLGTRWVYDAAHDPVALGCYLSALAAEQAQAELNVYDADERLVEVRKPPVVVTVRDAAPSTADRLTLPISLDGVPADQAGPALVATWDGGSAVVAFA